MRLSTLLFAILVIATAMGIARDEVGRVGVIVFAAGLGLIVSTLAVLLALFQTIGAFGEARGLAAHFEALAASAVVLALGSAVILGLIFVGGLIVQWAVP